MPEQSFSPTQRPNPVILLMLIEPPLLHFSCLYFILFLAFPLHIFRESLSAGKDKEFFLWQFIKTTNYQAYRLVFQYDNKVDLLFQVEKDGFHGI
jgi:hypothetical protein